MPQKTRSTSSSAPDARDYCGIALAYAKRAADEKNRARFGKWIRLAARRYLRDLERARKRGGPFYFDPEEACRACSFIEHLPHVEGKWKNADGSPQINIVLHESDVFFVVQLFGFRKPDGARRFSMALKAIARKNAKSTVAAAIGLYCQCCEDELGPQVISGATTGKQARIVFGVAKRMVEKTSALRDAFGLEAFANAIPSYSNGGSFMPINAKASTQDGLNPSTTILDEIHAHKTHDLLNVLRSAAGARANPLFLFTTTEGYESPGPWPELRHFAEQVLQELVEADHFLAIIYAVDEADEEAGLPADDDFDEAAWIKANPLIEVNPILLAEIRKEAIEAKAMPGRHAEFRIKRLNRRSSVAGGWVNLSKWRACSGSVDLEALRSLPCYGGLDLASTSDLCSFRLVWKQGQHWFTHGWRFVPRAAIKSRTERGLVPYEPWVRSGYLIEAGDEVIDYDLVREHILLAHRRFMIKGVGYDRWNAAQLVAKLEKDGLPMQEFIQGPRSYHPAMQELERAYLAGQLSHGNDPVLNWCASNLVARRDVNMNSAPDKRRAADKIDDFVALLMGVGSSLVAPPEKQFQSFFV
ncbi:MAG: Phage Terminase [Alphaproteobacteria bacterium ADurb.BinA305]|nr:MAG: Phage Terminase [Alphaproteobacteria bacterium ADurb.BinA305]